jgi:hypothetical protein
MITSSLCELRSPSISNGVIKAEDWPEQLEQDIRNTKEHVEQELRDLLRLPAIGRGRKVKA